MNAIFMNFARVLKVVSVLDTTYDTIRVSLWAYNLSLDTYKYMFADAQNLTPTDIGRMEMIGAMIDGGLGHDYEGMASVKTMMMRMLKQMNYKNKNGTNYNFLQKVNEFKTSHNIDDEAAAILHDPHSLTNATVEVWTIHRADDQPLRRVRCLE